MSDSAAVTVTDTPTLLYSDDGTVVRTVVVAYGSGNTASVTVGGPKVVNGQGLVVTAAGEWEPVQVCQDTLYAICATGKTATVYVVSWISSL